MALGHASPGKVEWPIRLVSLGYGRNCSHSSRFFHQPQRHGSHCLIQFGGSPQLLCTQAMSFTSPVSFDGFRIQVQKEYIIQWSSQRV